MKTIKSWILPVILVSLAPILEGCSGYIIASGPPVPPSEVIIQAPSSLHVWIPGHYVYQGGAYVWIKGYYTIPPKGKVYVPGKWEKTPHGYKRHKGHRRKKH